MSLTRQIPGIESRPSVEMCMEYTSVTGVFEGGGVRGVAIAGAAAAALDSGIRFDRSIGTSAGALVGSLVAAGYTSHELSATVCSVAWAELLDPVPGAGIPLIGKHLALIFRKGIYKGDRLEEVWSALLARKGVRVFGDLRPGALSVVVTDLNHSRGLSLPEALPRYGIDPMTFPVARAIRMSASIPFLFTPVPLHDRARAKRCSQPTVRWPPTIRWASLTRDATCSVSGLSATT